MRSDAVAPRTKAHSYDLALRVAGQGFALTIRNRGIKVSSERIDWKIDGRADAARLDEIAEVHLQTGGSWQNPIALCRITFHDGATLTVSDVDKNGRKDEAVADTYGAFVRDLHGRLAKLDSGTRFTAGYSQTQFHVIAACAVLLGAMAIGIPVVVFLFKPRVELFLLLGTGLALTVPLFTMLLKNSPRSYEPTCIPPELLP